MRDYRLYEMSGQRASLESYKGSPDAVKSVLEFVSW